MSSPDSLTVRWKIFSRLDRYRRKSFVLHARPELNKEKMNLKTSNRVPQYVLGHYQLEIVSHEFSVVQN